MCREHFIRGSREVFRMRLPVVFQENARIHYSLRCLCIQESNDLDRLIKLGRINSNWKMGGPFVLFREVLPQGQTIDMQYLCLNQIGLLGLPQQQQSWEKALHLVRKGIRSHRYPERDLWSSQSARQGIFLSLEHLDRLWQSVLACCRYNIDSTVLCPTFSSFLGRSTSSFLNTQPCGIFGTF